MSFNETYFYTSEMTNGRLKENGYGVKNVNDSREYYIYDSSKKDYINVDKDKYINYIEKLEQSNEFRCPMRNVQQKHCPVKQFKQFKQKQQCPFKKIPVRYNPSPKRDIEYVQPINFVHQPQSQHPQHLFNLGFPVNKPVNILAEYELLRRENEELKKILNAPYF